MLRTPAHCKQLKNMNNPVIYSYKGSEISFMSGDSVLINATQMAKPFDKRPNDYLALPSTNELIEAITRKSGKSDNQLVITKTGSPQFGGGTWFDEDVALDFAQWLSVDFRLWCNDRIKELLKNGVTTVSNDDEAIAYAMQVLRKRLETAKAEKERLQAENQLQSEQLKLAAPKVKYVDEVLQSAQTYTSTQVAKELGMREAEQLHKALKSKGIMFKQSGQWMLTAKYSEKGYTKPRTVTFPRSDGSQGSNTITVWTERGRAFLHHLFGKQNQSA